MDGELRTEAPTSPVGRVLGVLVVIVVIAGGGVLGWMPRAERAARLAAQEAERAAPPRVLIETVQAAPPELTVTLPATSDPAETIAVIARADGFVRALHADLGDHVRAGQLLAELGAPERDEEIRAASARLGEAEQRLALTRASTERTTTLSAQGVVTGQENDDAQLSLSTASAALDSQRAELRRLQALRGYQRIVAPFDGIVTARAIDRGALATANATVLFEIARPDVEVVVDVPQEHAPAMAIGLDAEILEGERVVATGRVARTASRLDPATRTMRIEIEVPTSPGLLAGMYLRARLRVPRVHAAALLPARALVMTNEGPSAWVVGTDDHAHLRRVEIMRDRGRDLEIATGVQPGDRVVLSAPDGLADRAIVTPVERGAPR
ncbi:efflux RND transporter periplasmic adaptor subunit [Sandaracinus amylolyticus]|uniref:Putative Co/Zn/Cd efflux system membrane fusion protein n=1 Tax=Sandaracinus amylolyticus TaxID=927083 RepID=A0A0F6SH24_9BACT|nr:efflux RND transporter periplasmic adaptor subunit [Sandaracinus amylolyticus]AKF09699.1 Putative Co/Zn/Cd efflux system membrane fusion protein [Sandaracinus amylolyticus]